MAAAYVAAMLAYVYAYANTSLLSDSHAAAAAILAVLVGVHLATGWASRPLVVDLPPGGRGRPRNPGR